MSWLAIPAVGTVDHLSVSLNGAIELIKLIGGLKDKLDDLSTRNAIDLLDELVSKPVNANDPVVIAVEAITKKPVKDIARDWKQLREKYNAIHGSKLRSLARNFKELNGEFSHLPKIIEWKIIDSDIDSGPAHVADTRLSLKSASEASIDIEAHSAIPTLPTELMLARGDKAVIRIGVNGRLELQGQLGFSAGAVAGHVAADVLGQAELDMYFLEEPDTHFGVAAAQDIKGALSAVSAAGINFDSPLNVEQLSSLLHLQDMHCMKISAQGTLMFDAKLGLAKTFSLGEQLAVKAGMEVASTITEKGSFVYLFAADETNGEKAIVVQVRREHAKENLSAQAFGIEVDPRNLFSNIQPLIDEHLGDARDALDEFKEFLPGSVDLNRQLGGLIDRRLDKPELKKKLRTLVGIDTSSSPEEVLRDRVIGVIETSADGWSEQVSAAVPGIVNQIVAGLERYSAFLPDIRSELENMVLETLELKQKLLKEKIKKTLTTTKVFNRIAEKLDKAGVAITEDVSNKQKKIDAIAAAVIELLGRLQKRISRLQDALQSATEKTVALKIASERKANKEESLDLLFYLYPERNPADAQQALDAIILGNMNKVIARIAEASSSPKPAIVGMNGGYRIYESLTTTSSSDLILWNFNLGSKSIIDADVRLSVNLDGTIVAQSEAEYTRIQTSNKEKRTVSFFESTEMIFAEHKKSINIGLTVSHEDEELKINEVSGFFNGLVKRSLLDPDVEANAIRMLSKSNGRNAVKGRLDVGLTLTTAHLTLMLKSLESMITKEICDANELRCKTPSISCPDGAGKKGCHWVLNTVAEITAEVVSGQHGDKNFIERLEHVLEVLGLAGGLANGIRMMSPGMAAKYSHEYELHKNELHYYSDFADMLGDLSFLEYRRYGAMALYEMLAHVKALTELGSTINPASGSIQNIVGMTVSELKAHQYRIAQLLPVWWLWGHEWKNRAFLTDEMRSLNVALFECWSRLSTGPDQEGEAPLLWASISLPDSNNVLVPTMLT